MKDVPVNRLEELSQFVHSLVQKPNKSAILREKILSYSGIFNDLDDEDYNDLPDQIKKTRESMFNDFN